MKTLIQNKAPRLLAAAITIAGAAFTLATAQANVTLSQGDLILGFRITSGTPQNSTYNLELALPSWSVLDAAAVSAGGTVNLNYGGAFLGTSGLSAADLASAYGSGWASLNLNWGVFGHNSGPGTDAWATFAGATGGTAAQFKNNTFNTRATTAYGTLNGRTNDINGTALQGADTSGVLNSTAGSYLQTVGSASPFYGAFTLATERAVPSATNTLDLYGYSQLTDTVSKLGTFNLDDSGNFSYTTLTPVPEPASITLLGVVAIAAGARRIRRRSATA